MRHVVWMATWFLAFVLPTRYAPWLGGLTVLLLGWAHWPEAKVAAPTWRTRWLYQNGQLQAKAYVEYVVSLAVIAIVVSGYLIFVVYGD